MKENSTSRRSAVGGQRSAVGGQRSAVGGQRSAVSNQEPGTRNQEQKATRIIYEDNHLLIVNKRPGEIVQGDKTGDEPLVETLKFYLKEKYNKPGAVFLGVVHRLDRPVSGAVVFARTSKALSRMNELLKSREMRKVYWAIVGSSQLAVRSSQSVLLNGNQEPGTANRELRTGNRELGPANWDLRTGNWELGTCNWTHLIHYLKRNEAQNKSYVYDDPGEGRQKAELRFRQIASGDRYDLLEVELLTGRHHQIRAQLAAIGFPIKGDLKYGSPRSNPDGSICLHSRLVEFVHPVSREMISAEAPVPDDKLWSLLFEAVRSGDADRSK